MEPAARDRFRAEAPRLFWDPELTAELRASRFPAVPLVVLTAGHQPMLPPFVPADAVWRLWQAELIPHLVALSPRGVHLVADCGHDVPNEAPDAVVEAIRRVVEAARGDQDSAGGGATLPPI